MKSWVKTGLLGVVIYLSIFLSNYIFVRGVSGDILIYIVTAPIYVILRVFGVVDEPGVYFTLGVLFYFLMGALLDLASRGVELIVLKLRKPL